MKTHSQTQRKPKEHFEEEIGKIEVVDSSPSAVILWRAGKIHLLFLLREERLVSKTATVKQFGNIYWVNPSLVGRRVEVRYEPSALKIAFYPLLLVILGDHQNSLDNINKLVYIIFKKGEKR